MLRIEGSPQLVIVGHLGTDATEGAEGKVASKMGGAAYFSAVGASLIETCHTAVVGRVGADDKGPDIVHQLAEFGLDTTGIEIVKAGRTAHFEQREDDRARRSNFKHKLGVSGEVTTLGMPLGFIDAKWFHLPTAPPEQLYQWVGELRTQGVSPRHISVDTFETYVRKFPDLTAKVMNSVGLVFLNGAEFGLLVDHFGSDFFKRFPYVLKLGKNGAQYVDTPHNIKIAIPVIPLPRIESTGAGEVLAGFFNAARVSGMSVTEALRFGVWAGGFSIIKPGVDHIAKISYSGNRSNGKSK